ncbi:MAG: glycosyltransferase family 2 protein [Cyclobacteriaceae bacterium]
MQSIRYDRVDQPIVSVIIPLFNRERLVKECLDSLSHQVYKDFEVIVVDDGSDDKSIEVVKSISQVDKRIQLFKRNRLPKGAPTCRNMGIDLAIGKYIIFLDSDDLLHSDCLFNRVQEFENDDQYDFLVFPASIFEQSVEDSGLRWNVENNEDYLIRFLKRDAVWQTMMPIYKRSYLQTIDGFQEGLTFRQDYEFHVQQLIRGASFRCFLDRKPDCYLRRHSQDSISQQSINRPDKIAVDEALVIGFINSLEKNNYGSDYLKICGMVLFSIAVRWVKNHGKLKAIRLVNELSKLDFSTISRVKIKIYLLLLKLYHLIPGLLTKTIAAGFFNRLVPNEIKLEERSMNKVEH